MPPPVPTPAPGVPSPCTRVCRMDPATGWCLGCLRTLDEITRWSRLDDAGKTLILAELPPRRAAQGTACGSPGEGPTPQVGF